MKDIFLNNLFPEPPTIGKFFETCGDLAQEIVSGVAKGFTTEIEKPADTTHPKLEIK